ncbi:hypothetical protein OsJ_34861 [Oryza sativa Japonica Group]|uniref:Uncharacterized protein n=1 Tax=Oryza sativa subsp. japonica TaxID=39947 RepID=A3CE02_ORYSJ|nr:hypothetical protein OsJ_34861 [Oryza sativa Japonica Group]
MLSSGPRHLPPPRSLATLSLPDAVEVVCVLKQVEERRLSCILALFFTVLRRMEQERRLVRRGTAGSVSVRVLTGGGGGEAVSFLFNGASMASSGAAVAGRTTLRARAPPWGKTTNAAAEGG